MQPGQYKSFQDYLEEKKLKTGQAKRRCPNCLQVLKDDSQCFECGFKSNRKQLVFEDFQKVNTTQDKKCKVKVKNVLQTSAAKNLQRRENKIEALLQMVQADSEVRQICAKYFTFLSDKQKSVDYDILVATAIHLQGNIIRTKLALRVLKVKSAKIIKFASELEKIKERSNQDLVSILDVWNRLKEHLSGQIAQLLHQQNPDQTQKFLVEHGLSDTIDSIPQFQITQFKQFIPIDLHPNNQIIRNIQQQLMQFVPKAELCKTKEEAVLKLLDQFNHPSFKITPQTLVDVLGLSLNKLKVYKRSKTTLEQLTDCSNTTKSIESLEGLTQNSD